MKANQLTNEERWLYMPKWEKGLKCFLMLAAMVVACTEFQLF